MTEENKIQESRLKNVYETRNYLIEEKSKKLKNIVQL